MSEQMADLVSKLPSYLGGHMLLSLCAMAVGLVVSLPLGIAVSRRPRLREWTLGLAGVIQTVPSLALLALMVPMLGGLIGFVPAFVALTLYSILPILAGTVVGLKTVDPTLIEAARGLGMNGRQMLLRVELPLAAPMIISGIRTATVLVVGTATLVTPVGGMSLGDYIFGGLESLNHLATVFGCVIAAVLAVVLDQLVHLLEVSSRRRDPRLARVAAAGLVAVVAGSLAGPASQWIAPGTERAVIASRPFTEQHVLNEMLAKHLARASLRADQRPGMSEGIQFEALFHGQVDVIAAYTSDGRIPAYQLEVLRDTQGAFPPYDALLLLSARAAGRPELLEALKPLVGSIGLEAMQEANYRVDVEKWTARRAAEQLLRRIDNPKPSAPGA